MANDRVRHGPKMKRSNDSLRGRFRRKWTVMNPISLIIIWALSIIIQVIRPAQGDILRIGLSDWMSDDGTVIDDSYRLTSVAASAQWVIAAKHFNERNTAIIPDLERLKDCPHNLSIIRICDDGAMRLKAANDIYDFVYLDQVDALAGYSETATAETASILAETLGQIPVISNWAQGDSLSNKATFPNFLRTWPTDAQYLRHTVRLLVQFQYTKVGLLYLDTDSGPVLATELTLALAEQNITAVGFSYRAYDGQAIDDAVSLVASAKTNVILCMMYSDDVIARLPAAADKHGLTDTQLWIFLYMDVNPTEEELDSNPALSRLMFGSIRLQHALGGPLFESYLASYWPTLGQTELDEINEKLPPFGTADSMRCINSNLLVKFTNVSTDATEDFFRASATLGSNWAETYDVILALGFAACSNVDDMPRNESLREALQQVNFTGMSGRVQFDSNGDRLDSSINFILLNWVHDETGRVRVASESFAFDPTGDRFRLTDEVQFRQGKGLTNLPKDVIIPEHNRNLLGGLRALGLTELAMVNTVTLPSLIWVFIKRHEPVVQNAQPEMLVLIVIGCLIASWSLYFLSVEDDDPLQSAWVLDGACQAAPFMFFFGLQASMVVFILKTMRVSWIYNNHSLKNKTRVGSGHVSAVICVLLGAELILLIVWTVLYPLRFRREIIYADVNGNPIESAGMCIPSSPASLQFLIAIASLHASSLVGCAYAANNVKKAPEKYHESKYIAIAVASITQAYVISAPVVVAVYGDPIARYVVLTTLVFISAFCLWFAAVLPKAYFFYTGRELISFGSSTVSNNDQGGPRHKSVEPAPPPPSQVKAHRSVASNNATIERTHYPWENGDPVIVYHTGVTASKTG